MSLLVNQNADITRLTRIGGVLLKKEGLEGKKTIMGSLRNSRHVMACHRFAILAPAWIYFPYERERGENLGL